MRAPTHTDAAAQDPAALVPMLRDVSRQEYLKKREDAKLQELKDELEDAE
jgi:pre-mRNA-splicing factor ATP-dependent RNA helicase DHX16